MESSAFYHLARFVHGAADLRQLPPDEGREIAFAGRSNAGKSSAINAMTGSHSLARISKTPGRTQQINFFALDEQRRLVDLPGYGYAKVAQSVSKQWQETLEAYLSTRRCLSGLIILMDVRHPLKDLDVMLLDWCRAAELPAHVLLTKADKLKRGPAMNALQAVRGQLSARYPQTSVQLFSAPDRQGLEELWQTADRWLDFQPERKSEG